MLTGTIPSELGLFKGTILSITNNMITGFVPEEFYSLPNLERLFLGDNEVCYFDLGFGCSIILVDLTQSCWQIL